MNSINKFSFSKFALIFILAISLIVTAKNERWKEQVIEWDIISYYAYLPGLFIYNDLTFSFVERDKPEGVTIWTKKTPDNRNVLKMTSGLAILYSPFFLIAHGIAKLQPDMYTPNGYSMVYSLLLILSDIFYTIIGLIYLRKILLYYFTDLVAGITLLCVFFGTNLLFYSMFAVMPHNYLFCLISMFLYYTIQWHKTPSTRNTIYLGLLFGLITLIRPVDAIVLIVFASYEITAWADIGSRINYLWIMRKQVLLFAAMTFFVLSIQMVYWKYATGHFFFWSYTTESFYWTNPHIIEGLFGFRKGWYVYTPIMFFATIGLMLSYKYVKAFTIGFVSLFVIFTYVIFSWWCWWYGGGLSCRPMIDMYAIMAIGLASFIAYLQQIKSTAVQYSLTLIMSLFVLYAAMGNIQNYSGALHYDSMSLEAWQKNFLKFEVGEGYYKSLQHPDYDKARDYGNEE